jgi:hypothetical protein
MRTRENRRVGVRTIRLEEGPAERVGEGKRLVKVIGEEAVVVDRYGRPMVLEKWVDGQRLRVNGIVTYGPVGDDTGAAMFFTAKKVDVLKLQLKAVVEGEASGGLGR